MTTESVSGVQQTVTDEGCVTIADMVTITENDAKEVAVA
jgi:hypothetical protein